MLNRTTDFTKNEARAAWDAAMSEAAKPPAYVWRCPKCKRWQSMAWSRCRSEYDTGIACDGRKPDPAVVAEVPRA